MLARLGSALARALPEQGDVNLAPGRVVVATMPYLADEKVADALYPLAARQFTEHLSRLDVPGGLTLTVDVRGYSALAHWEHAMARSRGLAVRLLGALPPEDADWWVSNGHAQAETPRRIGADPNEVRGLGVGEFVVRRGGRPPMPVRLHV